MPLAALTCPHCEKPVEIQVTAVTRSRPCPVCAQTIMLQVAEKETRAKRKALLMAPTPPTDTLAKPDLAYEPQVLPGDAFDRMRSDPEIVRLRVRFYTHFGLVAGLVVLAAVLHQMGVWKVQEPPSLPKLPISEAVTGESTEFFTTAQPENEIFIAPDTPVVSTVPQTALRTVPQRIARLQFRNIDGGMVTNEPISGAAANAPTSGPEQVLEEFLAAATLEAQLACVLDPAKSELLMRGYYARHPVEAVPYERIEPAGSSGGTFTEFQVVLKDGSRRFAAVVPTAEGYRVDWASFVALGDVEWEQMCRTRPAQPVLMRVLAAPGTEFSGQFSDSGWLRCVRLVPAANPSATPVHGYVEKTSVLGRELDYWLRAADGRPVPLTVRLRYPADGSVENQAWITELVAPGWVMLAARSGR